MQELFKQSEKSGLVRFNVFSMQIKLCYLKECTHGRSQQEVYNAIVEWLKNMTNGSRDACDVIVSFFVQNCEVFNEIAE